MHGIVRRGRAENESGLTLIELMIVVVILALTAMIAVPSFTRDRVESRFRGFVKILAHDLRRSHSAALGSKDSYQLVIDNNKYRIDSVTIASGSTTATMVSERQAPNGVVMTGVLATTAIPGVPYSAPSGPIGSPVALRLESTGGLAMETTPYTFTPTSATVFLKTTTGSVKARVVIYQATCQTQVYEGW